MDFDGCTNQLIWICRKGSSKTPSNCQNWLEGFSVGLSERYSRVEISLEGVQRLITATLLQSFWKYEGIETSHSSHVESLINMVV